MSIESLNSTQFGWHVAPRRARASIERRGLDPKKSQGKVWLFTDPARTKWQEAHDVSPHFDVWRANLTGLKTQHGSESSSLWTADDPVTIVGKRVKPGRLKRMSS